MPSANSRIVKSLAPAVILHRITALMPIIVVAVSSEVSPTQKPLESAL
jgi:hypothetical protein